MATVQSISKTTNHDFSQSAVPIATIAAHCTQSKINQGKNDDIYNGNKASSIHHGPLLAFLTMQQVIIITETIGGRRAASVAKQSEKNIFEVH
jgi:hypothetical protein